VITLWDNYCSSKIKKSTLIKVDFIIWLNFPSDI
jgi:hypothetical protein